MELLSLITCSGEFGYLLDRGPYLADLRISAGTLNPSFNSRVTEYSVQVGNLISSTYITPLAIDPDAVIKINGSELNSGSTSDAVNLSTGSTLVSISVNSGGVSRVYSITFLREITISSQNNWGTNGQGDGQLNFPAGMVFDSSGNIFVANMNNHRIQKFDPEMSFLFEFGTQGLLPGQLNNPAAIILDTNGNAYISEMGNSRIQHFH